MSSDGETINLSFRDSQKHLDEEEEVHAGRSMSVERERGAMSVREQIKDGEGGADGICLQGLNAMLLEALDSTSQEVVAAAEVADRTMSAAGNAPDGGGVNATTAAMVHLAESLAQQAVLEGDEEGIPNTEDIIRSEVNGELANNAELVGHAASPGSPHSPRAPPPQTPGKSRGTLRKIIGYLLGCQVLKDTVMPALLITGKAAFRLMPPLMEGGVGALSWSSSVAGSVPSAGAVVSTSFGIAPWVVAVLGMASLTGLGLEIYSIYNKQPEAVIGNVSEHREFITALHQIGDKARADELRGLAEQVRSATKDEKVRIKAYKELKLAVEKLAHGFDISQDLMTIWASIAASGPWGGTVAFWMEILQALNEGVGNLGDTVYFQPFDVTCLLLAESDPVQRRKYAIQWKKAMLKAAVGQPHIPAVQGAAAVAVALDVALRETRKRAGHAVGLVMDVTTAAKDLLMEYKEAYYAGARGKDEEAEDSQRAKKRWMEDVGAGQAIGRKLRKKMVAQVHEGGGCAHGLRKKRRTKKKASIKSARKKCARKSTRKKSARKSKGSKRTYRRKPTLRKTRGVKRKSRK
jgi:hypothetical protein